MKGFHEDYCVATKEEITATSMNIAQSGPIFPNF
jgi:hypothetical protein